jgi:hypothetical protein
VKKVITLVLICVAIVAYGQNNNVIKGALPLHSVINFSDPSLQDWSPVIVNVREAPRHVSDIAQKKALLDLQRKNRTIQHISNKQRSSAPLPIVIDSFPGNPAQGSTPLDNTLAISSNGMIVSCVNTQIDILDTTGRILLSKSLATFANRLGYFGAVSDPKVVYDPAENKFVLVFFSGSRSNSSVIVVAFSQTNDPTGGWNFYKLSGSLLRDTTWSDYPILSLTHDDFFMTFNQLADDSFFPAGFKYSVIWQIDKQRCYNGDTLKYNYWHNVDFGGKSVWNICPVQGGSALTGPDAYFLSVRPHDLSNDTVFLHHITNSYVSNTAQISTRMLITNTRYGLPPNAPQIDGQHLATNDARVLCAMIENDRIQYVQNSIDPTYSSAGVYLGTISGVSSSPVATGQVIGFDTIDLGYPSIAYIGNGSADNRAMITCSYLPAHGYPGTCAFYIDNSGLVSDMLPIKAGHSTVNMLTDSTERWGDYTGIQRAYNRANTLWLNGSCTNASHSYQTYIARLYNTDNAPVSGIVNIPHINHNVVFPNPAKSLFSVEFDLESDMHCTFTLVDAQGRVVRMLMDDDIDAGTNRFSFGTAYLATGTYYLHILSGSQNILTRPVVVSAE